MNEQTRELIDKACRQIQIRDVVLYGSSFEQQEPLPRDQQVDVVLQAREGWNHQISRTGDRTDWVHVHYLFGVRLLKSDSEDDEEPSTVYYTIEAEFVASYRVKSEELDEDAVAAFAEHNSKHNIWPFWRQHVFDVCQRARVSPPEIGLYPGNSE